MSVANGDGSEIDDAVQNYAPVNGISLEAFAYVTVTVGQTLICGDTKKDAYKHYVEMLLGTNELAKKTYAQQSLLWYPDTPTYFDEMKRSGGKNQGFLKRSAMFVGGHKVETRVGLPYPLAQAGKLLPPGINMTFDLKQAEDQFRLMSDDPSKRMKLIIDNVWLEANGKIMDPNFYKSMVDRLTVTDARYDVVRSDVAGPFHLPPGQIEYEFTLYQSVAPNVVYCWFVDSEAWTGSYTKNPFNFQHCNVSEIYVTVEGVEYPADKYTPVSWGSSDVTADVRREYLELMRISRQTKGIGCGLTYEEFINGYTILAFQIAQFLPSNAYVNSQKGGDTKIYFKLKSTPVQRMSLFAMGVFDNVIYINPNSAIVKNFVV